MELLHKLQQLEDALDATTRDAPAERFFVECALAKAVEINDALTPRTEFGAWGSTRCINGYNESNEHEQTSNSHRPAGQ